MGMPACLLIGVAGLTVGSPVAAYGILVPAKGPLPRPSWPPLVRARPRWMVATGALLAGVLSLVLATALDWSWELWAVWPSGVLGVGLVVVDVRRRRLPSVMTGAMYAMSIPIMTLEAAIRGEWAPMARAVVGCLIAVGLFLAVALALPGQLGLGDVVLIGWIAMTLGWLGWPQLGIGLLAGLLLQTIAAATLMVWRRGRIEGGLPMGAALVAGWLVGVVSLVAG